MTDTLDTREFKVALEEEFSRLEQDLSKIGRRNPSNPDDWEPIPGSLHPDQADRNEVADSIEEYETNTATLKELEIRYNNVKRALEKIAQGNYGICEISGEAIEIARLRANPAARTCKAHMHEEERLIG